MLLIVVNSCKLKVCNIWKFEEETATSSGCILYCSTHPLYAMYVYTLYIEHI